MGPVQSHVYRDHELVDHCQLVVECQEFAITELAAVFVGQSEHNGVEVFDGYATRALTLVPAESDGCADHHGGLAANTLHPLGEYGCVVGAGHYWTPFT